MKIIFLKVFLSVVFLFEKIYSDTNCKSKNSPKRMICYFASWSNSRPAPGNMEPENFDPCICTHVLYSFVDVSNNKLSLTQQDESLFKRMANWKNINSNLKISISVGGWNAQSGPFNPMVMDDRSRQTFCQSVIDVSRKWGLDGIDIDWEYPSVSQKDSYTETIKKCYDMFVAESSRSGNSKLIISAATGPDLGRMAAYDLPKLNNYFDFVNPMTYDMHGSWDGNGAHHSPLFGGDGAATTLQNYIRAGFSASKLNLGLAAYGRSTGLLGQYTREGGILSYYEVCQLKCQGWKDAFDDYSKVPKAIGSGGYVFYDNVRSIREKANYVLSNNIGGAFIWDTSLDDFNGKFCCQGKFPLISTAINVLTNSDSQSTSDLQSCCYNPQGHQTTQASTTLTNKILTTTETSFSSLSSNQLQVDDIKCNFISGVFAYPNDCSKFIRCTYTTKTIENCPNGLVFNSDKLFCDWPKNVNCQIRPETTTFATKTNPITFIISTTSTTKRVTNFTISSAKTTTVAKNLSLNTEISNSTSATTLTRINNDTTTLETTDFTLTSTLATIIQTPATTLPTTTIKISTSKNSDFSSDFCSVNDLIQGPNCNQFYLCGPNNVKFLMKCPEGLKFNLKIKVCDWPSNVAC